MTDLSDSTRRAARRLRYVTLAGMVLIAAASLYAAVALASGRRFGPLVVEIGDGGLPGWPAAGLMLLIGALLVIALARLARMLRAVEGGTLFAPGPLRGFAFYLFLAVLVAVLGPPLIQAGQGLLGTGGAITLSLGGGEALMLFVTGLLFFVARLLDAAQAIADDARQIV